MASNDHIPTGSPRVIADYARLDINLSLNTHRILLKRRFINQLSTFFYCKYNIAGNCWEYKYPIPHSNSDSLWFYPLCELVLRQVKFKMIESALDLKEKGALWATFSFRFSILCLLGSK